MRRRTTVAAAIGLLCLFLLPHGVSAQGINPLPIIAQDESGGNPAARSLISSASGLYGFIDGTWAQALASCGSACGNVSQYPSAYLAPANIQSAAAAAYIDQYGLGAWLCARCDAAFASQVAADGGVGAFQTSGLSTDPSAYANSGGTPLSTGGLGVGAGTADGSLVGGGGGQTTVTDQPGTNPGPGGNVLDTVASYFQTATAGWQDALFNIALDLFWILAAIELAISLYMLLISDGASFLAIFGVLIRWLMAVGIFSWLMLHATEYTGDIINSLRQAGGSIGSLALTPSAMIQAAVNIGTTVWNNYHGFWGTLELIPVMLAILPSVAAVALVGVWMLMLLIESYFVIGLSVLMLAFGGLHWTRHIAISVMLACIAVGFKLLAMEAIAPLATQLITQMAQNSQGLAFQGIFTIFATSIAFAALAKIIPDRIERIVLNLQVSIAHWQQPVREAGAVAGVAVGGAALATGSVMLAAQSIMHAIEQLASQQNGQQGSQGSSGRISHGLSIAGGAAGVAVRATGSEIGARLGGLVRGGVGSSAVRIAGNVAQRRRVAAAEQSRPQPPQPATSSSNP